LRLYVTACAVVTRIEDSKRTKKYSW